MDTKRIEACSACRYFERVNEYGGKCRFNPPTVLVDAAVWMNELPYVGNAEWCGQFALAPAAEPVETAQESSSVKDSLTTRPAQERCDGSGIVMGNETVEGEGETLMERPCTGTGCHPVAPAPRYDYPLPSIAGDSTTGGPMMSAPAPEPPDEVRKAWRRGWSCGYSASNSGCDHSRMAKDEAMTFPVDAPAPLKCPDCAGSGHIYSMTPYGKRYMGRCSCRDLRRIKPEKETTHDDHDPGVDSVDSRSAGGDRDSAAGGPRCGNAVDLPRAAVPHVTDDTPARGESPICDYCVNGIVDIPCQENDLTWVKQRYCHCPLGVDAKKRGVPLKTGAEDEEARGEAGELPHERQYLRDVADTLEAENEDLRARLAAAERDLADAREKAARCDLAEAHEEDTWAKLQIVADACREAERERDEARVTLATLSSWLGHGIADPDSTSVAEYEARIRQGVDTIVRVETQRREKAERRVEELERLAFAVADGLERGFYGSHVPPDRQRRCQCSLCNLAAALAKEPSNG